MGRQGYRPALCAQASSSTSYVQRVLKEDLTGKDAVDMGAGVGQRQSILDTPQLLNV